MPTCEKIRKNRGSGNALMIFLIFLQIHLPNCITKEGLYKSMCAEFDELGWHPCHVSHFRRIWPKNVKIPKV